VHRCASPAARRLAALGVLSAIALVAAPGQAFERQWHFGGGVGFADASEGYPPGPALGLHGAYGLSDVFDLRLELTGSRHVVDFAALSGDPSQPALGFTFLGARAGLSYKLDVIQWIPFAGVSAGGIAILAPEGFTGTRASSLGLFAGVDYAATRSLGAGLLVTADYLLTSPTLSYAAVLLRGEYRFGW